MSGHKKAHRSPDLLDRIFGWKGDYKGSADKRGGGHVHGRGSTKERASRDAQKNARKKR